MTDSTPLNHTIPEISVIIASRNGRDRIPQTINSLLCQRANEPIPWELIFIDNGSTDNTAEIVQNMWTSGIPLHILTEPKTGKSHALNRALLHAQGEILGFIDDDVIPQSDWLTVIHKTFLDQETFAIMGKVILPDNLLRPWMQPLHRSRLASTEVLDSANPVEFLGANMAIRRKILDNVPSFDTELGPGALGFGDDSLFSYQLLEAGYKIKYIESVIVEHHFEEKRLYYTEWINDAKKRGESRAYIAYHWAHVNETCLRQKYVIALIRLIRWKISHPINKSHREGCSIREIRLVEQASYLKRLLFESKRERLYDYRGLIKRDNNQN